MLNVTPANTSEPEQVILLLESIDIVTGEQSDIREELDLLNVYLLEEPLPSP